MKPNLRGITCLILSLWLALAACGAWAQGDIEYTPKENTDFTGMEAEDILKTRVTLNFREADLQDILRLIAVKSKLNIIMNPSQVSGKVTLRLENVKLGVALNNILRVNGLAYIPPSDQNDNIVRIVSAESVSISDVETVTRVFQINWVDVEDVQKAVQVFLSDGTGKAYAEPRSQTITIVDVPEKIEEIESIIKRVDQRSKQVEIEARFVDINLSTSRDLGINLDFQEQDDSVDGSFESLVWNFAQQAGAQYEFGQTLGILGSDVDITGMISMLESRNIGETLANPRVVTLNNEEAWINLKTKIPYTETSESQAGNQGRVYKDAEIGVEMWVTPQITPNNYVNLDIKLANIIFNSQPGGDESKPITDNRDAEIKVLVKSYETIMIGGLRQVTSSDTTEGVPWFHQIPVIGWLFKGKGNGHSKNELYLFVTPKVLGEPVLTTEENGYYKRIDTKWDLPDYFFDDVKTDEDMD